MVIEKFINGLNKTNHLKTVDVNWLWMFEPGVWGVVLTITMPYGSWKTGYLALDVNPKPELSESDWFYENVDVHGGITYAVEYDKGIVIGYDTNHLMDNDHSMSRTVEYNINEVRRMYEWRQSLNANVPTILKTD